jgi:hypothetical protein
VIKIASNLVQNNGVVAILHHARDQWSVLIAGRSSGKPAVRDATSVRTHDRDGLESLLARHNVTRVICVLPSSAVVCRTCTLPNADAEQLEMALELQVESNALSGGAPEHRTSMGLLPAAPGETSRTGLVLTWPEQADIERPPTDRDVTYAPDIAALAALMDTQRPADPILWADPDSDAVGVCITHANGAIFRALRERATTSDEWRKRIVSAMAETAASVGHTGPFIESLTEACGSHLRLAGSSEPVLLLPEELIEHAAARLDGASTDAHWWKRYGIAAGVLLADASDMAAFTNLIDEPEIIKPTPVERVMTAMSTPRTATMVAVVCLLLLALTPLVFNGLRLLVLKWRYPDIEAKMTAVEELKKQNDMYAALNKQSWSMTKILSDLVCNTPEGVKLEMIDLQQSGGKCTVSGEAIPHTPRNIPGAAELSATEVLALMQKQLGESRIFDRIDLDWDDTDAYNRYKFNLSAQVVSPYHMQRYDLDDTKMLDFAWWTLMDREGGREPVEAIPMEDDGGTMLADAGDTTPPVRDDPTPPAGDNGGSERTSTPEGEHRSIGGGAGGVGSISDVVERDEMGGGIPDVPPELTEAMVRTMSVEEVRAALGDLSDVRRRVRRATKPGDEEMEALSERLRRDQDLLMRKLRGDL